MADDLRHRIAEATRAHYLDGTDWEGNDTCVCGGFGDGKDTADWDAHLADAVMAVRDDELLALRERAEKAERVIDRVENLRDKWLAWPVDDVHYAAGLMLAKYLSDAPPTLDDTEEAERG